METNLLLIKCISLLYREAEINSRELSHELCNQVLANLKIPEETFSGHSGREVTISLRSVLLWMLETNQLPYDRTILLQRLKIATRNENYLYDSFSETLDCVLNTGEIQSQIVEYRRVIREFLQSEEIKLTVSKAYQKLHQYNNFENYRGFVAELCEKLRPFTENFTERKMPGVIDYIRFDNEDDLERVFKQSKEELSNTGVLKTGWQAINKMLGSNQGFRRGEFVIIGALQHSFKTGFTLNLFKHFALYNKPYMRDNSRQPLLLHISIENEMPMNLRDLYANLKENETGEYCDVRNIDIIEASKYIKEKMSINGYTTEMVRIEPDKSGYQDLFDLVIKLESEGFEIHAIICDYLHLISKKGIERLGPNGSEILELFRRVRNFCSPRGITFITPHQLSSDAKGLVRHGVDSFVQEIANKGYYEGCRTLDTIPDLELYIHIERVKGQGSFLTCQRGKHRGVNTTDPEHLYTVLPFNKIGGILDDINKKDRSLKSVGGNSVTVDEDQWDNF